MLIAGSLAGVLYREIGKDIMSNTVRMPKPRTEAQRAAARANGAKSKGPVTEEGKSKSALNALRHGLLAGSIVLSTESRPKFEALLSGYVDEYQPEGQTENDLVEEIAAAKWQQQRCWMLITSLLDATMTRMADAIDAEFEEIDAPTRTALAFLQQADQGGALVLLNRYVARHARDWHRAIDKLRAIQKERREQSAAPTAPLEKWPNEPEPDLSSSPSTTSKPQLATDHWPLATERSEPPATERSERS